MAILRGDEVFDLAALAPQPCFLSGSHVLRRCSSLLLSHKSDVADTHSHVPVKAKAQLLVCFLICQKCLGQEVQGTLYPNCHSNEHLAKQIVVPIVKAQAHQDVTQLLRVLFVLFVEWALLAPKRLSPRLAPQHLSHV